VIDLDIAMQEGKIANATANGSGDRNVNLK
jgi:hypothetical protein